MITTIALILALCLCLALWFAIKNRQKTARGKRDQSLAQLEEVLRTAQLTNNGFFQSLELVQKNLEALLARAESAEQRMRNLMLQPGERRAGAAPGCVHAQSAPATGRDRPTAKTPGEQRKEADAAQEARRRGERRTEIHGSVKNCRQPGKKFPTGAARRAAQESGQRECAA